VTDGKHVESVSDVDAANSLATFYDIHGKNWAMPTMDTFENSEIIILKNNWKESL
jgi:hypothetical protein